MHSTTVAESNENVLDNENTLSNNENNIEKEIKKVEEKENMLQFGDNLDIPTFLRNRKI